jgi:DNA-binding CsgD family transcriptional regulator
MINQVNRYPTRCTQNKHMVLSNNYFSFIINKQKLTFRETQCLAGMILGMTAKQIARSLEISPRTAETHINSIKSKTGSYHRSQVILKALMHNFPIHEFLQCTEVN